MVFYEATSFGLRVTTFEFINTNNNLLKIRLIPMVHIGEEKYYKNVEDYIRSCDLVLYEEIKFKTGRLKIKNMKITADRLGMVTQRKLNLTQFKNKLIHADITKDSGKKEWDKLSFFDKLKFKYLLPIYIYFQDRNLTRKKFVKYFMKSNEDLEEIYGPLYDEKETIKKFIHDSRDKRVFEELDKIHNQTFHQNTLIGIVYGAGHMKAISKYMMNVHNYKVIGGEFIDVFSI